MISVETVYIIRGSKGVERVEGADLALVSEKRLGLDSRDTKHGESFFK